MFNVGDKVKVLTKCHPEDVGSEGVIKEVLVWFKFTEYWVDFTDGEGVEVSGNFKAEHLEKL